MIKENEIFKKEENKVFFYFNEDFPKLFSEPIKDRTDKKIMINLAKENLEYFYYLHKVLKKFI